jgi:hypothetical protein
MKIGNTYTRTLFFAGLTLLTGLSGCFSRMSFPRTGELRTESLHIARGAAKSARVELKMGSGELKVTGGAADLAEGTFSYNVIEWKPRTDYHVSGDRGELTIEEPSGTHSGMHDTKNTWDLRLNDSTPLELDVEVGAGRTELNLGALSLTRLDVQIGAGEAEVDLAGDWKHDVDVHISGGVGHATIKLPQSVGVRATVEGGIGSVSAPDFQKDGDAYVNSAYGKSRVTVHVDVQGGIGDVHLELSGGSPIV